MKEIFLPTKLNNYHPYLLNKFVLVLALSFLAFTAFVSPDNIDGRFTEDVAASSVSSQTLISMTNSSRQKAGLPPLKNNSRLTQAALLKADNMLEEDYWDHYGPNGETPWQFILEAGYTYTYAGENLARGFSTSEGVHQAWLASPTHKANIMNDKYTEIGIAVVNGTLRGQQTTLVVQMFGSPGESAGPLAQLGANDQILVSDSQRVDSTSQILSIAIKAPEQDDEVSAQQVILSGTVEVDGENVDYSITASNLEDRKVEKAFENTLNWDMPITSLLAEGQNTITASVGDLEDSVEFIYKPAQTVMSAADLDIAYKQGEVVIRFDVESIEIVDGYILLDGHRVAVTKIEGSELGIKVDESRYDDATDRIIFLRDSTGIGYTIDLSVVQNDTQILPFVAGVVADPVQMASIVAIAMFTLYLAYQMYHYHHLKMYKKYSLYMFTFGIWVILLMISSTVGSIGDIS